MIVTDNRASDINGMPEYLIEMLPCNAEDTLIATKQLGLNRLEFDIDCLVKQMGLS